MTKTAKEIGEHPAFPAHESNWADGMTYRQWLIGRAMQGFLACCSDGDCVPNLVAAESARTADAVLKQLAKEDEQEPGK